MASRQGEIQEEPDETFFHPSRSEGSRPRRFQLHRNHRHRVEPGYERTEEDTQSRQVLHLPCSALDFYKDDGNRLVLPGAGWNPILKTLLLGTRSRDDGNKQGSPLSVLRSFEPTLLRHVYSYLSNPFAQHVRLTIPADLVGNAYNSCKMTFVHGRGDENGRGRSYSRVLGSRDEGPWEPSTNDPRTGYVAFCKVGKVQFPSNQNRNVNMMPFILGDKESLPDDIQCYYHMIHSCPFYREEFGNVAYLIIQESYVDPNQTQRRPGLHIESPGVFPDPPSYAEKKDKQDATCSFSPGVEHPWGMGVFFGPDRYEGGIYIASNTDNSTEIWDALVDRTIPGIVDHHGGCEHLRSLLSGCGGGGTKLAAGDLVWMTDCTPHEALPQSTAGTRQFFRLVMPNITHWYADHSTVNPKVPLPDSVTVIRGSKFSGKSTYKHDGSAR